MSIRLSQQEIYDLTGECLQTAQICVLTELNILFAVINDSVVVMRQTIEERNQCLRHQWRKHWKEYDQYTEKLESWQELSDRIKLITPQPEPPLELSDELRT